MLLRVVRGTSIIAIVAIIYWVAVAWVVIIAVGHTKGDAPPLTQPEFAHMIELGKVLKFPLVTTADSQSIRLSIQGWGIDPEGQLVFGMNGLLWGVTAFFLISALESVYRRLWKLHPQ